MKNQDSITEFKEYIQQVSLEQEISLRNPNMYYNEDLLIKAIWQKLNFILSRSFLQNTRSFLQNTRSFLQNTDPYFDSYSVIKTQLTEIQTFPKHKIFFWFYLFWLRKFYFYPNFLAIFFQFL